jgi:formyl-CoA transferase
MDREDLKTDPRFANPEERVKHRAEVDALVSEWTRKYDKYEVMKRVAEAGVPSGAVLDTEELTNDPTMLARGTMVRVVGPDGQECILPGNPIQMSGSQVPIKPAPALGSGNERVLSQVLGLSKDEIGQLKAEQAI